MKCFLYCASVWAAVMACGVVGLAAIITMFWVLSYFWLLFFGIDIASILTFLTLMSVFAAIAVFMKRKKICG